MSKHTPQMISHRYGQRSQHIMLGNILKALADAFRGIGPRCDIEQLLRRFGILDDGCRPAIDGFE